MRIEFFIAMVPPKTTFQAKQLAISKGKPIMFDSPGVKAIKRSFMAHLAGHVPEAPLRGPVRLVTKWCWPRGSHPDGDWKATKPDTDNMLKAFRDAMERVGFFEIGDSQVASEVTEKFWAEVPGIYVMVEEIA